MNFTKMPLFALMTQRMNWLAKRQEVLAHNVANADTPGYRPLDVKPADFGRILRQYQPDAPQVVPVRELVVTHPDHIQHKTHVPDARVYEPTPAKESIKSSGNAVVLEDQLMQVGKTMMDYQLTTRLYRRTVAMIRTAIGRGGAG